MSDSNNTLLRAVPVLNALKARLEALQWTGAGGGVPAFGCVLIYDLRDQVTAMKELLALDDRVAMIIYEGDQWTHQAEGQTLTSELVREVTVLVSDRQRGDRMAALLGNAHTPGAFHLADLAAESLRGVLPVSSSDAAGASRKRAWMKPVDGRLMVIEGKLRDEMVGRATKLLTVEIECGTALADLGESRA